MNEKKIIQIAANTESFGLENKFPLKAKSKNKVCGDEIAVEVNKDINEMRFETQSCIFTQASAAILANHLAKMHKLGLENVLDAIKKKLNGETVDLPIQIKDLNFLTHKDHKTRKECIALPFNAVIKAIHD